MYDRTIKPIPQRLSTGIRYRIESLIGITGANMAKYRSSWYEVILSPFNLVWRPHLLAVLIFEVLHSHILLFKILIIRQGMLFGFSVGINVTQAVFFGSPPPIGFGLKPFAISGLYGTPIVCRSVSSPHS
jgi:hypothetical protein